MGQTQSSDKHMRQGGKHDDHVTVVDMEDITGKRYDCNTKKMAGLSRVLNASKMRKKEDAYNEGFDRYEDSMMLLKQIFKKIDPNITQSSSFTSQGQLELLFKYDATKEVLLVKIIKAQNLNAKNLRGKSANTYVKIRMSPTSPDRISGETAIDRRTLTPIYNEIFAFQINEEELKTGTITCQVWDSDLLERDEMIGEVHVRLTSLHLTHTYSHTDCYHLHAQPDSDIIGCVEVSIVHPGGNHLVVTVHSANNITNRYTEGAPNPFVKLQVIGLKKLHETKVQYNTTDPDWNQCLNFDITRPECQNRYLVLHVLDYNANSGNDSLGQVIISLNDINEICYHDNHNLADLRDSSLALTNRVQNTTVQELRESLIAHACAKTPSFLFNDKSGSKIVSVCNTRKPSTAKLRIKDGLPVY